MQGGCFVMYTHTSVTQACRHADTTQAYRMLPLATRTTRKQASTHRHKGVRTCSHACLYTITCILKLKARANLYTITCIHTQIQRGTHMLTCLPVYHHMHLEVEDTRKPVYHNMHPHTDIKGCTHAHIPTRKPPPSHASTNTGASSLC